MTNRTAALRQFFFCGSYAAKEPTAAEHYPQVHGKFQTAALIKIKRKVRKSKNGCLSL